MEESLINSTPFDQYSRQYQVAQLIEDIRKGKEIFRILDVGGYKGKTANFFPEDDVWVLDVFDIDEPNYIQGDGTKLSFENNDFDFIVSFDVLEHLPPPKRNRFIDECNRVSEKASFVSAPQKTEENESAEIMLNDLYKSLHSENHRWLQEHIEYGLPDFEFIQSRVKKQGIHTLRLPSNDTILWILMQGEIFMNSKFPMGAPMLIELNSFYNQNFPFDGGADIKNTYRLILAMSKDIGIISSLRSNFAKKNYPLDLSQKLELINKIHEYQRTLLTKMSEHTANLEALHKHEAKRAKQLHINSTKLYEKIQKLEHQINTKKGPRKITAKLHGHINKKRDK